MTSSTWPAVSNSAMPSLAVAKTASMIACARGSSGRESFQYCRAVTASSDYPDALVQLAALAATPRAGDLVVSAARTWDLRSRWEPIAHRSTHGALHREHMLVPLVTNHPVAHRPRRTVDVMPSALTVLGVPRPNGLDGRSFC